MPKRAAEWEKFKVWLAAMNFSKNSSFSRAISRKEKMPPP